MFGSIYLEEKKVMEETPCCSTMLSVRLRSSSRSSWPSRPSSVLVGDSVMFV